MVQIIGYETNNWAVSSDSLTQLQLLDMSVKMPFKYMICTVWINYTRDVQKTVLYGKFEKVSAWKAMLSAQTTIGSGHQ